MEIITQNILARYENVPSQKYEKSNFSYSFSLLPQEEKDAMNSLYAFCSYIDDIVDSTENISQEEIDRKMSRLAWWENEIEKLYDLKENSLFSKHARILTDRFPIPKQYFITLIDGCRRDLVQNRYETFEELKEYCYSVAGIVGLMSIEIFGYKYEETKNYAINLGYALQLTNIIRDVKADKDRGFIYIPQEDMRRFGYTEDMLKNEVYNSNFVDLMRFQADRAKKYYHTARSFLRPDEKIRVFSAGMMDEIYYRLLEKIELNDYNVFRRKIRVSTSHKLMIVLKHWLSLHLFVKRIKKEKS